LGEVAVDVAVDVDDEDDDDDDTFSANPAAIASVLCSNSEDNVLPPKRTNWCESDSFVSSPIKKCYLPWHSSFAASISRCWINCSKPHCSSVPEIDTDCEELESTIDPFFRTSAAGSVTPV